MLSKTSQPLTAKNQATSTILEEVKDRAFISNYNESDYNDFLYLAPPISAEFLQIQEGALNKPTPTVNIEKDGVRTSETFNAGTTLPQFGSPEGSKEQYSKAKFPPSGQRTSLSQEPPNSDERRERRHSFVEVTPVKLHFDHDRHENNAQRKEGSHSSHEPDSMSWWPDSEAVAQHEWVEGGEKKDCNIEEEIWSYAFAE